MDPVEIFRGHHISNFEKKIREITDYIHLLTANTTRFIFYKNRHFPAQPQTYS